jgi:hypothetical protein
MKGHRLRRGRVVVRTTSALVGAAVLCGLAIGAAAPPADAAIGPFTVTPASGPPGTPVTVSGSGCSPGLFSSSSDYVSISSTTLPLNQHASVSGGGSWSASFTVPQGTPGLPALIAVACFTDGLPSLTTIYTPGTFLVTPATPPTSVVPPPPTSPVTTATTRGTTSTTRASSSTTKAGSKGGGNGSGSSSATPGAGTSAGRGSGRAAGGAGRGGGSDLVVAGAGSVAAERRSGAAAGLRSPELTSDTSTAPGGIGWWWWLVVVLLIGAAVGTTLWVRRRLRADSTEPNGDDGLESSPADDDDPLGDGWLEHSFVDDTPSVSR